MQTPQNFPAPDLFPPATKPTGGSLPPPRHPSVPRVPLPRVLAAPGPAPRAQPACRGIKPERRGVGVRGPRDGQLCVRPCVSVRARAWKGWGDELEAPTPRSLQLLLSSFHPNEGLPLQPCALPAPVRLQAGTAREGQRQTDFSNRSEGSDVHFPTRRLFEEWKDRGQKSLISR